MTDKGALKLAFEAHCKDERHHTVAETRYWCRQYKLIAQAAIAALAEHAMRETQRIGQEIEQEPIEYWNAVEGWVKIDEVRKHFDSVGCGTIYKSAGEGRVPLCLAQPEQDGECKYCTDGCPACDARKLPEQEPVGVVNIGDGGNWYFLPLVPTSELPEGTKFYTTPPQRTWVGLTKEQISEFDTWYDNREEEVGWVNPSEIVAYIDAKLKQKNGYAEEKNT